MSILMIESIYAVAGSLKLIMEQIGDTVIQEMFYICWSHDYYMRNVFEFSPSECCYCMYNKCTGYHT